MRWTHRTERLPTCVKHTLAFKVFSRYLIVTWAWTA